MVRKHTQTWDQIRRSDPDSLSQRQLREQMEREIEREAQREARSETGVPIRGDVKPDTIR